MQTYHYVANNGHIVEQTDILEGARNALMVDLFLRKAGQLLTIQIKSAGCGFINAGQQIENGGFTSAIGANQPIKLFFPYIQVQLILE